MSVLSLSTESGPSFGAPPSWPCSPPWRSAATARFSATRRRIPSQRADPCLHGFRARERTLDGLVRRPGPGTA